LTKDRIVREEESPVSLAERRNALGTGRLGVYSALGAGAGTVPLPWIPDTLARRIRGALVQDVTALHGLSLTPEARAVLSEPQPGGVTRGFVGQAVRFATGKLLTRFTPLGFLPPLRSAAQTFALGHLLNRYLDTKRTERSARIDVEEARRVRKAIDESVMFAIRADLQTVSSPRLAPADDQRNQSTQLIDGVLIAAASLPDWLVRRLNAAFDERVGVAPKP
jgi:uncharacterized protein (DUF697 family)